MRAGFEGDVNRGTRRFSACLGQRHRLGMWPAAGLRPTAPDNAALLDNDAPNRWIVARAALAAFGKGDGGSHKAPVV